jgi:hypothetical protein
MQGAEVYTVLKRIETEHLYHANTVTTSSTFLEQGGLASRGFVEDRSLKQTPQPSSDEKDKKYGIWNRVFLDHVDIHYRAGRVKGPNHYGPVLFLLDLDILLQLPIGSDVLVTKNNPIYWFDNQPAVDRWFRSAEELAANLEFGNFNKMLVIQTPAAMIPFPHGQVQIMLDDPKKKVSCGQDAYSYAYKRLQAAARTGRVEAVIAPHECRGDCTCVEKYAKYTAKDMDFCFT